MGHPLDVVVEGAPSGAEPAPPPPASSADGQVHGRAGRNLPVAIGVGVALGGLILLSLYVVKAAFVALVAVAMLVAVWELTHALGGRGIASPLLPVGVGTLAMIVGAYVGGSQALVVALALTVLGIVVWRLTDGSESYVRDTTAGVFTAVYVPFMASFAVLLVVPADGEFRVTTFFLVTTFSDIGGYAAGVLFGRHPLAPTISPKKSWEGFAGSAVTCMAAGALSLMLFFDEMWWKGVLLGASIVVTATLGDLGESMVKRDLGVKDMGHLLPGHGGIMDRVDSLLLSAPVAWVLLTALVPVTAR